MVKDRKQGICPHLCVHIPRRLTETREISLFSNTDSEQTLTFFKVFTYY